MSPKNKNFALESVSFDVEPALIEICENKHCFASFIRKKQKHMCQLRNLVDPLTVQGCKIETEMIPYFKMGYYHQKDYIRPCQMSDKIKKPMGFEYTSFISSKTYSILSYIVGGFVGSKSQMNNDKHLSYDLSAAIFNLLNPQKTAKRPRENFYCSKLNYDKYYQKTSFKDQAVDLELGLIGALSFFEENVFSFNDYCDKLHLNQRDLKVVEAQDVADRARLETVSVNPVAERSRKQSESSIESTDSESFIVFDDQYDDKKDEGVELEPGSEDGDDEDEEDCSCDEYDVYSLDKELAEANDKWSKNYEDVAYDIKISKRVRFSDDVKVNKIVAWDYAYRAARPGPWEQMARDRVRFQERILRLSSVICPILERDHREKIYKELYS